MTQPETDETASTLRDRVSREIRRRIISGELRPGERLLQQQLAKHFGVSQSVMREALLQAQFSGLVVASNGAGASVAAIDLAQVMHAYEAREAIEGLAARICCQRAGRGDVRELADLAQRIHSTGIAGDDKQRAQLDRQIHERIIAISGNPVIARLAEGYHVVRLVVLKEIPHEKILADHVAIVDAIREGDEDAAERAARSHVVSAREMIRTQLQESDFAFPWEVAVRDDRVTR